jgi:PDZ domain-containing protein
MAKRRNNLRFSRTPWITSIFLTVVTALAFFAPMNFVLITPGDPTPLFPKTLSLSGVNTYKSDGQLYLLTIMVTNPETKVLGFQVIGCWIWGDCAVMPRSVMYEDGATDSQEKSAGEEQMQDSQSEALLAAVAELKKRFPATNVKSLDTSAIKVSLKNTGGPSGGLIFAIGMTELLTQENILHGRKIAGTGTISKDGAVGAIGGVAEKILGAQSAGASLLFVSQENCSELPSSIEGIGVVAVSTLDQAIEYLLQTSGKKSPTGLISGCSSL